MTRRVCVVTGTRAEYGLLHLLLKDIQQAPELELQLVVTGMHLSPKYGSTYREIERDGFRIDAKIDMELDDDAAVGLTRSMGIALAGFGHAFEELKPDILLILGDRFEIFSAAAAAMMQRIPIAHLHGGEATEGVIDEPIRHSITKMAHFHFVAAEPYRKRVIQLGEQPDRVFQVGALGVDNIKQMELMNRQMLEQSLSIEFAERNLLVTFHPVTLEDGTVADQMIELLAALDKLSDTTIVFTMPNADTGAAVIFDMIEHFCARRDNAHAFTNLGQLRYFSCLRFVDGVVGNSSSGLIEVPSFRKGTVNIGDRQRGRLKAESVIDCAPERSDISRALDALFCDSFRQTLRRVRNPYGQGGASKKIVEALSAVVLDDILKKRFYDIPVA